MAGIIRQALPRGSELGGSPVGYTMSVPLTMLPFTRFTTASGTSASSSSSSSSSSYSAASSASRLLWDLTCASMRSRSCRAAEPYTLT